MAAPVWDKMRGIVGNLFQLGGPVGPNLKNSSGVIELRNDDDSDYATGRAAHIASGAGLYDLVTLLDLQGRIPNITFDFAGASAPGAGTNTGEFGFVHTTGGIYTAGQVVYDDGATLIVIPTEVVRHLTTSTAVSGTISLIQNGLYAWQSASWILKGDGAATAVGLVQCIEVDFDFNDAGGTVNSTTQIPDGAIVLWSSVEVETAFDGSSTALLFVDGTSDQNLILTTENWLDTVGSYQNRERVDITSSTTGTVGVTVAGTAPTVGVGRGIVEYVTPQA